MFDVRELNIAIELWGVAFCVIGIVCALLFAYTETHYHRYLIAMFSLAFVYTGGDALAGLFRGQSGTLAWAMTRAGNFVEFVSGFFLSAVFTTYVCYRVEDSGGPSCRGWRTAVWGLSGLMCVATACGLFYYIDAQNLYHRSSWYWVSAVGPAAVNLVNAAIAVRNRSTLDKKICACLLFYALAPAIALAIQIGIYGLNFVIVASVLGLVVLFIEMQSHVAHVLVERTEELAATRVEVANSRIAVMVSQIQPHFIFNALDTVYGLVDEDPELAKEAVASFASYLRTNLDSLKRTSPVPIEAELKHVQTYLELEHMADEEKIAYVIDAPVGGFCVPALSAQTLAENAVRHGVDASERGGCVWVRTRELPKEYTVSVVDDGVGFDPATMPVDASHVGLANTRERLAAMCGGTLEVTSAPGKGTTVVMHIPKATGGVPE